MKLKPPLVGGKSLSEPTNQYAQTADSFRKELTEMDH